MRASSRKKKKKKRIRSGFGSYTLGSGGSNRELASSCIRLLHWVPKLRKLFLYFDDQSLRFAQVCTLTAVRPWCCPGAHSPCRQWHDFSLNCQKFDKFILLSYSMHVYPRLAIRKCESTLRLAQKGLLSELSIRENHKDQNCRMIGHIYLRWYLRVYAAYAVAVTVESGTEISKVLAYTTCVWESGCSLHEPKPKPREGEFRPLGCFPRPVTRQRMRL